MYEAEPDDAQRELISRAEAACTVHAIRADGFARAGAEVPAPPACAVGWPAGPGGCW